MLLPYYDMGLRGKPCGGSGFLGNVLCGGAAYSGSGDGTGRRDQQEYQCCLLHSVGSGGGQHKPGALWGEGNADAGAVLDDAGWFLY